jgi:hypothetical protein
MAVLPAQPSTVVAQTTGEPPGFKNVTLWINPEYDDPRLLVMLQGQLDGATAPVKVKFLVPSQAEMYSAGSMDAQGNYSGGPPERAASAIPGWDEISYELKTNTFRVEYYNGIIPSQADKSFSYEFRTLYPISDMKVIVQEPLRSSNYTVNPDGPKAMDNEGFTTHTITLQGLQKDQPVKFEMKYSKTDPHPSLFKPGPTSTPNGQSRSSSPLFVIVGIVLLVIVVGGGIFWYVRAGTSPKKRQPAVKNSARTGRKKASVASAKPRFCTRCGQPVGATAKFCPSCGNKLRDQ